MRPAHIIDRRAGSSVLAVQSVPIEEHEVRGHGAFRGLVHPKESFHRGAGPAFCLRVEDAHARTVRGGSTDDRALRFGAPSALPCWLTAPSPGLSRSCVARWSPDSDRVLLCLTFVTRSPTISYRCNMHSGVVRYHDTTFLRQRMSTELDDDELTSAGFPELSPLGTRIELRRLERRMSKRIARPTRRHIAAAALARDDGKIRAHQLTVRSPGRGARDRRPRAP